jgi:hypothetical protein
MKDLVVVLLVALALYVFFGPKRYRPQIVGMSKADAAEVVRADGSVPVLIPEGSMIVAGGGGSARDDTVVAGTYGVEGVVQTVPTIV